MNSFTLLPAYWEILNTSRLIFQHAGLVLAASLLGVAVWKWAPEGTSSALVFPAHFSKAFLASLFFLAFASLVGVALVVLQNFSNSADEYSCLFLAKCFASKKLYGATDALVEFFHFTHIGEKGGKWFSVYPPGWPLLLVPGLVAGIPWIVNPLLGALTLVFVYRLGRRVGDERSALLACLWIGSSSFFLFNAGSYFSHTACFLFLSLFLWCFMVAVEAGRGPWFFLSGLALGYAMMTRYLSAIAFGAPFVLYLLWRAVRKNDIRARHLAAFFCGLAVFNGFQLWFQYRITGNPFLTPIHYFREHERLGFSRDFPPWLGLGYTLFRVLFYAQWTVPGLWLLAVAAFFVPRFWDKGIWDRLFLTAGLLCGSAYMLYYSFGGNAYGPRYFFESMGVLGIMAAKTFFFLWDRWKGLPGRVILALGLAIGFGINAWNVCGEMNLYRGITSERKSLYRAVDSAGLDQSVVFIRDWVGTTLPLPPTDLTRNSPGRDDSVLYVQDLGEKNQLLMDAMPQRRFYVGTYDKEAGVAHLTPLSASQTK